MTDLGCVIDLAGYRVHFLAAQLPKVQLVMSKSGHLAVRIDDWPVTGFPVDAGVEIDTYTVS
eukprot:4367873-Pyramimonas_sp.AAC.1